MTQIKVWGLKWDFSNNLGTTFQRKNLATYINGTKNVSLFFFFSLGSLWETEGNESKNYRLLHHFHAKIKYYLD